MKDVDVLIPTLRRPDQLSRALRSVFAQTGAAELICSVVVVDNSPEASAVETVEALRPACPVPLALVHEPRPGVANARNAGLGASSAPLVAFIDDDEEAPPDWLAELRKTHLKLGSAVTFGPVKGVAPDAPPEHRAYLDRFFSRLDDWETGLIPIYYGCGNSMMTRALALTGSEPFDLTSNFTGGEDDRLFSKLRQAGLTFGWAADAWVWEYAPAHRANLGYALKRAFCYGQSPSSDCMRRGDWIGVVRNMAIGMGQMSVYGVVTLAMAATGRRAAAVTFLDRTVRGLGKVCWPVRIKLYGLTDTASPISSGERAAAAPRLAARLQA
jgi:succinoglycan biosynthesis protein ExoM